MLPDFWPGIWSERRLATNNRRITAPGSACAQTWASHLRPFRSRRSLTGHRYRGPLQPMGSCAASTPFSSVTSQIGLFHVPTCRYSAILNSLGQSRFLSMLNTLDPFEVRRARRHRRKCAGPCFGKNGRAFFLRKPWSYCSGVWETKTPPASSGHLSSSISGAL
jgi:hypothetical protein